MTFRFNGWAVLLTLALLAGCQQAHKQSGTVYFGPTAVYRLPKGTHEAMPDTASTAFYERRFNFHPRFNQPLHRIVAGSPTETVYLGIAMPPVPANLQVLVEPDAVWQVVGRKALPSAAQLALLRGRNSEFNVRYVGKAKSGNVHVVNLLTRDSVVARSYYDAPKPYKGNLLL
ncbi:hypothetical protein [Hymenobacter negativus]|uniref:DUF4251 domain-containing protein n=1 Tax=Hymenobacter negativus TaxID=2795026 RepID=A0ABS3QJD2_9BACT|nr:hypothetical protein [Hymenobacter negativus]MBO2011360.1 hypothetical protein [Hymenobacter negativus]